MKLCESTYLVGACVYVTHFIFALLFIYSYSFRRLRPNTDHLPDQGFYLKREL